MSRDGVDRVEGALDRPDEPGTDAGSETAVTDGRLVRDALAGLRRNPSVVVAMLLAGLTVAVVDWVRVADPVPVVAFRGVQAGRIAFDYGVVASVTAGTTTPPSALVELRPAWVAWVAGLELLRTGAVALAGAYGLARLLDADLTVAAAVRYVAVFACFGAISALAPSVTVNVLVGLPFVAMFVYVVAHLVPLPGLLAAGRSVTDALGRSWRLATGHGWTLATLVVGIGLAGFLAASAPVAAPLLGSLVVAVQLGVVAAFLRRVDEGSGPQSE